MKKTITLLFVTFVIHSLFVILPVRQAGAQTPNWQWAKSAGGTSFDNGVSCSTDAGGNIFVTGYFRSSTLSFGTTVLTNADNTGTTDDMLIVKYDAGGNVLWAKSAGGTSNDYGWGCSTDAGGNIFVTGSFGSPTLTFGTTVLTKAAGAGITCDMFIVKYDAGGNVLWAQRAGGTSDDVGQSCSTDAGGNIFVTGFFVSPTLTFGTTVLTKAAGAGITCDMFIVKYDGGGNVLWAKSAGGTSLDYGQSCSTDAGGNIFVTGYFFSPTITFGTTVLTNVGNDDMFIVKYDAGGNVFWAKSAAGTSVDYGWGCSTDTNGNIFVTGYFSSPTITFGTTVLTNAAASADMFIVKYDAGGNVLWAKSAGGTLYDYGWGCSTDAGGNIFVTGSFDSSTLSFGTTVLTNAGWRDMFIVKYDPSGNALWAKSAGGTDYEEGRGCSTDAGGNIFVTGFFNSPTLSFGTTVLTNAGGGADMFIVKLDAAPTGIENIENSVGIIIYPNPSSGKANVKISQFENLKMKSIEVYNVYGEKVYDNNHFQINSSSNFQIDLSSQPNGVYFLNISALSDPSSGGKTEQGTITQKLIISK